ncbi:hypothetical protein [Pusillimonas sp. T2]|uniref:hypothetical protein n=1 Tax=Pusillimonas sp. T2 TaxID=1548123 RepID=UPI00117A9180|nr:hypothetical protein [Pusillimonas sp. T2]
MSQIVLHTAMALTSASLYGLTWFINYWAFLGLEEITGVNWIFLPAGIRLLCTLLFGFWGTLGLWAASFLIATQFVYPEQFVYGLTVSVLSALSPYLIYLSARRYFGLLPSLHNLSPQKLLVLCGAFGMLNAIFHHSWYLFSETNSISLKSFVAMATGDIAGAVIVMYALKIALMLFPKAKAISNNR